MTPDRFFSLLLALQTREVTTTPDLALQLGVSARTVLRDLQWLQEAGLPVLVQRGRHGGVRLLPGGALDTSRLTPAERDHLALHGLDDSQRHQLGTGAESRRARDKLKARQQPDGLLPISAVVATDNKPWFGSDTAGADPSSIIGDVRRGVRIRIHYRRSDDVQPSWQLIDPYGLLAKAGRWYLVADHSSVPRLYALERLVDWRPTRTPRRTRPGVKLTDMVAELTSHWETVDAIRIHAILHTRQLDRARRLLGSRLTVRHTETEKRVNITVACREIEDVRQLLPFAGSVTVTEPPEARDRIQALAREMLNQYP